MANYQEILDQLTVSVQQAKTVTDGAVLYIQGVPALIQSAIDEAVAAGATPEQTQAFNDLKATLDADIAELEAALLANTPEEPPVQP